MMRASSDTRPIALYDSGVGGLSILREVRRQMPHENLLYFADRANVPYGPRPLADIQRLAAGVTRFLLSQDAKAIVVACNAASAASLHELRAAFPETPFVGMEPAVKPAAENTQSGVIGVITTQATFQGKLFASVMGRFAQGVQVETQVCPDFVELVEAGKLEGDEARSVVRARLEPLLEAGVDQLVLGCTHFPFLEPLLSEEAGPGVTIVDPAGAVARQVARVVDGSRNGQTAHGSVIHYTSGDVARYAEVATQLLGERPEDVRQAEWQDGELRTPASHRAKKATPISTLRNIGEKSAGWLADVGLHTEADLIEVGVVEAYRQVKMTYPDRVTLNLLYGLQAALLDIHWTNLPQDLKDDLKKQAEAS